MTAFIRGFYFALVGWVVGSIGAGLAAPAITWYNVPGQGQAMCDCRDLAQSVVMTFFYTQLVVATISSLLFLMVFILFRRSFGGKKAVVVTKSDL